jgi:hypothetical protein
VRAALEDKQDTIAQLKDLKGKGSRHHPGDPWGQAPGFGIVLLKVLLPFFVDGLRPGLERDVNNSFDARSRRFAEASQVRHDARIPGALAVAKIRMTIG